MDKIQAVENQLQYAFHAQGKPEERFNILEQMDRYHIPGMCVAMIENGEIAWSKAYGVLEAGRTDPVTPHSCFQAASISKPVAALAALRLVEQGRLDLDEDVNRKLVTWKVPENEFTRQQKVTLRRLLSHNAGLTVHGFEGYAAGVEIPTVYQVLDGLPPANSAPVRVDAVPGSIWRYSGGGITVAQLLVSEVHQRPFRDIMREEVLERAGMVDSGYDQPLPVEWVGMAAVGHRADGTILPGKWHTYPELAAAGLWTTPSDLARFAIALRNARLGKSPRLLQRASACQALAKQFGNSGIGVMLSGEGDSLWFGHGGSNEGFRCELFMMVESGMGAAVMTNADSGNAVCLQVLRSICSVYGLPAFPVVEKPLASLSEEQLQPLAGTYEFKEIGLKGDLRIEGGMLVASFPGDWERIEFLPENAQRFYSVQDGIELIFERDAQGLFADLCMEQTTLRINRVDG
jgi:CubicO group peptidase (beta-lactamase class C family)